MTVSKKRFGALAALAAGFVVLAGCMMVPGKFASELILHKDGRFTYRYDGEIYLLAMSELAEAGDSFGGGGDDDDEFVAQPCFEDDFGEEMDESELSGFQDQTTDDDVPVVTVRIPDPDTTEEDPDEDVMVEVVVEDGDEDEDYGLQERECTTEELAEQREAFDERMERAAKRKEQQAQMMNLFFGGIDPSDPDAADELVKRLERQRGWKSVVHKGNGLFEVSFEITSVMGHDFVFPTFERFPLNNFILTAAVREPGRLRIDAPGFAVQGGTGPMGGVMSGMVGAMQIFGDDEEAEAAESFPELDGTFTLVTDGAILANNTDEGPEEDADGMQRLSWTITPRTRTAPMALIGLD
ncbi:hypothetical protein [Pseudoblastomonas halimionae]|uniref:Lipoprotein n=1 Tax=Alteriqipengyuania halimionae TaxID=1926630 RepID=A0A6I4U047_9SPHN|nr:hypothetical protein [Alteriqipengyuania halimionae]MXP09146.1 hypothetical protein [Alteriqipengyuania halimionae]